MKRIAIVGGVAGGATCAARVRRLDESAEVVIFERGPHVSFANCGLPYYVGDVIHDEKDLLLMSPERFRARHAIDVRIRHEVVAIDRAARELEVRDLAAGKTFRHGYDALVLATGARPVRPDLPGIDQAGVFELRNVPDANRIRAHLEATGARRAVVVGAGLVGLELCENLHARGLSVTVIEAGDQVLGHLDPEMAGLVASRLREVGVDLRLGVALTAVEGPALVARLSDGAGVACDLVILCIGVRPETTLARAAGLPVGRLGGLVVDAHMATADPAIWAVGDVVEDPCTQTGRALLVPLAGPANRQGRVAADAICGRPSRYRGVQGTAVVGLFGRTVASTGTCQRKMPADMAAHSQAVWLHPNDHVAYYPGAKPMHMKLVFADDGRILGAQIVGEAGVERRIDVIATAMQLGGSVYDLEEAELAYAPQYGAAKDPVNVAGMIAANHLRGDMPLAPWAEVATTGALLLDVREAGEFRAGSIPGAVNLPLSVLRDDPLPLPRDREIWVFCQTGKRSYDAGRALLQMGYQVRQLSGGIETWRQFRGAGTNAMLPSTACGAPSSTPP